MNSAASKDYFIISRDSITPDTISLKFGLAEGEKLYFLPGDHMQVHYDYDGEQLTRPYTPVSTPDDRGFFELIIKKYPTGIVSSYLHSLEVGQSVAMSGPHPGGHFVEGMATKIGMIAGGAGITPMVSIVRTIIRRKLDVKISLLFANKTAEDIILREEFENYARQYPAFRVLFALDIPPQDWGGHKGHFDEPVLAEHLPSPGQDVVIFLCGPPMMEFRLREKLLLLGYGKKQIVIP